MSLPAFTARLTVGEPPDASALWQPLETPLWARQGRASAQRPATGHTEHPMQLNNGRITFRCRSCCAAVRVQGSRRRPQGGRGGRHVAASQPGAGRQRSGALRVQRLPRRCVSCQKRHSASRVFARMLRTGRLVPAGPWAAQAALQCSAHRSSRFTLPPPSRAR